MRSAMGTSNVDVDGVVKSLSLRAPNLFPSVFAGPSNSAIRRPAVTKDHGLPMCRVTAILPAAAVAADSSCP